MPKVKTLSSAKKRVKITGTGKYIVDKTAKRHLLKNKSSKAKGRDASGRVLPAASQLEARLSLPYGR
jgi:large subunit ribosomal protein L35